jgi:multidrug efflux pump subunit AcrB
MREVASVPVYISAGNPVPASTIATFERVEGKAALSRLDRADVVYMEPIAAPGRAKDLFRAVETVLAGSSNAARSNESAFRVYGKAMAGAVILVLVLLYLTLGAQFESFRLPLLIMGTIPLAMAGVGPVLVLTGTGLDSGSILGLVVLFGVVVNNAILLYEASAARRQAGAGAAYAAFAGASDRVRPVLATTLTTIVALLPMCLSSTGAAQRSLAMAVLGGLAASTALTLFISPIAFAATSSTRKSA